MLQRGPIVGPWVLQHSGSKRGAGVRMSAISQPFSGWQKIRGLRVGHPASLGMGTAAQRYSAGGWQWSHHARARERFDGPGERARMGMGAPPGAYGFVGE